MPQLEAIASEFSSMDGTEEYDRWFRAMVQAALDGPGLGIPHDHVEAEMHARTEERRRVRSHQDQ